VSAPATLRALRDVLNGAPEDRGARLAYAAANGLLTAHGEIAYDDLPTYGGDPVEADGVYSWSAGQLLIRVDADFGVGNQLNGQRVENAWALVPRDALSRALSDLIEGAELSVTAFARAIGRDRGTVEAWLTGETVIPETMRRWIPRATVVRAAGAVQITVAD